MELVWGGNEKCEHQWQIGPAVGRAQKEWSAGTRTISADTAWAKYDGKFDNAPAGQFCSLCGAVKSAYGLEPSPEMYIEHSLEFLREIRRVLRKDGVCFFNMGDSYASHGIYIGKYKETHPEHTDFHVERSERYPQKRKGYRDNIIKPKDLCGIPSDLERAVKYPIVACSHCGKQSSLYFWAILNWHKFWCPYCEQEQEFPKVVERGWWVRSMIIWNKLNPMPESVTDRPTTSHEYILMLTKSANCFWDADAVREKYQPSSIERAKYPVNAFGTIEWGVKLSKTSVSTHTSVQTKPAGRNLRSVWTFATEPFGMEMCNKCKKIYEAAAYRRLPERAGGKKCHCAGEDYTPSWIPVPIETEIEAMGELIEIIEQGYQCEYCGEIYTPAQFEALPEARVKICHCGASDWLSHFATFPEKLPEICIKAATPPKCCAECGAPWKRITFIPYDEAHPTFNEWRKRRGIKIAGAGKGKFDPRQTQTSPQRYGGELSQYYSEVWGQSSSPKQTLGWQPTCSCNAGTKPSVVLDPFCGSGTTVKVAKNLNRQAIGYDLSEDYLRFAAYGLRQGVLALEGQ